MNASLRILFTVLLSICGFSLLAQHTVSGTVLDEDGLPVIGANTFIKDTYDGASTDADGNFSFETEAEGQAVLIISSIGFKQQEIALQLDADRPGIAVILETERTALHEVVIAAGSFEASDAKKSVIFKPLDIVTTAGATADIAGALNTLPGTQTVGEEGKLFVRGGDDYETRTFIDGMVVHNPYGDRVPDQPTRGRFSPFLFTGTVFATGGYSAEYGQALSSALLLNTADLPDATQTDLSIMSLGGGLAHTQRYDKGSFGVSAEYFDLAPYFEITPHIYEWTRAPYGFSGSLNGRKKVGKDGMWKGFSQYSNSFTSLGYPTVDDANVLDMVALNDGNLYLNTSYRDILSKKWTVKGGLAATVDKKDIKFNELNVVDDWIGAQGRLSFSFFATDGFNLRFGTEYAYNNFKEDVQFHPDSSTLNLEVKGSYASAFAEADAYLGKKVVVRAGVRSEYDDMIGGTNVAPRVSVAFKTGKNSQISAAYGLFYQTPDFEILKVSDEVDFERAEHMIANFQWMKEGQTFRIETYLKRYRDLILYGPNGQFDPTAYTNDGYGHAAGLDLFWRDSKSIRGGDYWISYSFLDTERWYRNYPGEAVPTFASAHNLSVVYKQWWGALNSYIGTTYSLASPRPYNDPNNLEFNGGRTKTYHDLSLNWSYITSIKDNPTVVYFSITNIPGFNQEFGYNFGTEPNDSGMLNSSPVKPDTKRFFFVGVFINFVHKHY